MLLRTILISTTLIAGGHFVPDCSTCTTGWSELAPTNAPVADEPVEAVFWMDENPTLPARFFFFFSTSLPQNFPPSYLPPTSPRPTYHLPTPPPPHSIARAPETSGGCGAGAGAVAVELERLELEQSCWSWSGTLALRCFAATQQTPELGSGACVAFLQRSTLRSQAPELALRCFAATQQAPKPGSGACVAFLQRSKLRAPELALLSCNAASSGLRSLLACCGLLAVATQQAPERESLLLQHSKLRSLLQLNPATQQALERLL